MVEPEITPQLVQEHGLTEEEYQHVLEILGRKPTYTELGIFSVMWSEHCSYKNTRALLKSFPTQSPRVLVGAGEENAGIIDIGDGLAVAFKIESHNHPSAVEPFQGAATGVGGIIRDIFTMGARPVCAMNSLRFGELTSAQTRRLFAGVVSGIAHYGNCYGIPTLAGEVYFDASYEGNPLVNAFCLGVLRHDQIARGAARGVGNPVFYVGPPTGRDGLAGAAFASQDLTEKSAEVQRGAVQVGDPFMEKLLTEACLELLATDAVAGIQDMGAAGLTCSTCETAARAGTGIEIELNRVPQRAPDMTPYEIMLSESQERMLIIVNRGQEDTVRRIFDKWDLPWAEIGAVTDTGRMIVRFHGEIIADVPAKKLADEAPLYHRESSEPDYIRQVREFKLETVPDLSSPDEVLKLLLKDPNIASKNWVYRQYDHMVRNGTVVCPGSDAAVLRIKPDAVPGNHWKAGEKGMEKYLALTVDCNGTYVYLDPYEGSKIAVAEAARNLACSGAEPLGTTDNLNFGNPHRPDLFWQLKESVRGLSEGCRAFDAPVTGGNVSLYNQNPKGAIQPTPTLAMVGQIRDASHITTQWFKDAGHDVLLLGGIVDANDPMQGLGGSAYLRVMHGLKTGTPPRCDLELERRLHDALRELIRSQWIQSAHDCSEGGLLCCLAECCLSRLEGRNTPKLTGVSIQLDPETSRMDALLFGETQGRIVISTLKENRKSIQQLCENRNIACRLLGETGGTRMTLEWGGKKSSWDLLELHDLWWNAIAHRMSA